MTPEERFNKYWEHTWTFGNPFTSEEEDEAIKNGMKAIAKNAFLNAFKACSTICEAWFNQYRFGGKDSGGIIEVWQTINGNHPNKEIKI